MISLLAGGGDGRVGAAGAGDGAGDGARAGARRRAAGGGGRSSLPVHFGGRVFHPIYIYVEPMYTSIFVFFGQTLVRDKTRFPHYEKHTAIRVTAR